MAADVAEDQTGASERNWMELSGGCDYALIEGNTFNDSPAMPP